MGIVQRASVLAVARFTARIRSTVQGQDEVAESRDVVSLGANA
jgi:hypothetical protein